MELTTINCELSSHAYAGLSQLAIDMCDAKNHRRGDTNVNPLIQAIGSGLFSIVDQPDPLIACSVWASEIDMLQQQAFQSLSGKSPVPPDRFEPGEYAQRRFSIDESAVWGLKSLVGRLRPRRKLNIRRRYSTSMLIEKIGLGMYTVLPVPDIYIRFLYLESLPVVAEYLNLAPMIAKDRRKHREN